jgi:hypothetical protein
MVFLTFYNKVLRVCLNYATTASFPIHQSLCHSSLSSVHTEGIVN